MNDYSLKRAAGWTGLGLAFSAAAGGLSVYMHEAANHFATLQETFAHVAQPEALIAAVGVSTLFGAFMEFRRCYYNESDKYDSGKIKASRPAAQTKQRLQP